MRAWRERNVARGNPSFRERLLLKLWAYAAKRPRLYHLLARLGVAFLSRRAGPRGRLSRLPFTQAWTKIRDLPAPQDKTFHQLYAREARRKRR